VFLPLTAAEQQRLRDALADDFGNAAAGGAGGGGSDRTAFTYEVGITVPYRILTETVDGVVWTYAYDVLDRPTSVTALGVLTRTITYDATTGFATASGNIYRGQQVVVTSSQMATIRTALIALALSGQSPQFYVSDFNGGTGLGLGWNCVDNAFRTPGECIVGYDNTPVTNINPGSGESTALMTVVMPAWLRGNKGVVRIESFSSYTVSAEAKNVRLKLNAATAFVQYAPASGFVLGIDAEIFAANATDFLFPVNTALLASGAIGNSTGAGPTTQSVVAGTDLTFTITDQLAVGAAINRTTHYLRVSYRHP
jgi:YD repeat-containing protein